MLSLKRSCSEVILTVLVLGPGRGEGVVVLPGFPINSG